MIKMGNQLKNKEGEPFPSLCKIENQQENLYSQVLLQTQEYTLLQKDKSKNKEDKSRNGVKIKRIQGSRQRNVKIRGKQQRQVSSQESQFHNRMQKAYNYMKSLRALSTFSCKYGIQFPLLILNKDKQITKLRKEIMIRKASHPYFVSSEFKKTQENGHMVNPFQIIPLEQEQNERQKADVMYFHFLLLEKLERNIIRILQTGRHHKVLKQIKEMDNLLPRNPKKEYLLQLWVFVAKIDEISLEFLDMLFYQLSGQKQMQKQRQIENDNPITEEETNRIPKGALINVKQLIIKERAFDNELPQSQNYEKCKSTGLDIYRQNKVCFYILASSSQFIDAMGLYPLNLPKNPTLLELFLQRYDAFAQLIQVKEFTVFVLIGSIQSKQVNQLMTKNSNKWNRLNIIVLKHTEIPCLDLSGNLILTPSKQENQVKNILKIPVGTGDLWDMLREEQNRDYGLQFLENNNFQFIQVIGSQNCLEHCFDCFMLGTISTEKLNWGTKIVQPCQRLTELNLKLIESEYSQNRRLKNDTLSSPLKLLEKEEIILTPIKVPFTRIHHQKPQKTCTEPIIYCNQNDQINILSQNEQHYHQKLNRLLQKKEQIFTFTNHSILRVDFVKQAIKNPLWKQSIKFRKKLVTNQENNEQLIVFQKDLSDIFKTDNANETEQNLPKYRLFKYERQAQYYPLAFRDNKGVFDIEGCSKTLSLEFLSFLDISIEKHLAMGKQNLNSKGYVKCYIDPHISLQGQDLAEIKHQIEMRLNEMLVEGGDWDDERYQNDAIDDSITKTFLQQEIQSVNCYLSTASRIVSTVSEICVERQLVVEQMSQQEGYQQQVNSQRRQQKINIFIN